MGFQWPLALLSLLVVPVLLGAYVQQLRRRRRRAVRYSSVALIRAAVPPRSAWRRHLPFALMLGALAALGVASARPQVSVPVPISASTMIIALDVSGSMCATDVPPNRLTAAQAAVQEFVKAQDPETRIGLVLFSGFAQVVAAPTTEREALLRSLASVTTGRGTTIGAAILKSIDAIAEINPDVAPADPGLAAGTGGPVPGAGPAPLTPSAPTATPTRPPGTFAPEIVVLLTDGRNTRGVEPLAAAAVAADRGIRIYPIGFGTQNPTSLVCTAAQSGGRGFDGPGGGGGARPGGGGGGGGRSFLVADEPTLRKVASVTGGQYFSAPDAEQLQALLADLPDTVGSQQREVEVSVALVALAAALLLLTGWAAARWTAFPT